jgi:hypothetical protein
MNDVDVVLASGMPSLKIASSGAMGQRRMLQQSN